MNNSSAKFRVRVIGRQALSGRLSVASKARSAACPLTLDVLVRALLRICEDPYDRLFSRAVRNDEPQERMAELGDLGFMEFWADEAAGLMRDLTLVQAGRQGLARCCRGLLTGSPHASARAIFAQALPPRELDAAATRESLMWRAWATEQASRSSLGTTRVLPVRTAARGLVQAGAGAGTRIYGSTPPGGRLPGRRRQRDQPRRQPGLMPPALTPGKPSKQDPRAGTAAMLGSLVAEMAARCHAEPFDLCRTTPRPTACRDAFCR